MCIRDRYHNSSTQTYLKAYLHDNRCEVIAGFIKESRYLCYHDHMLFDTWQFKFQIIHLLYTTSHSGYDDAAAGKVDLVLWKMSFLTQPFQFSLVYGYLGNSRTTSFGGSAWVRYPVFRLNVEVHMYCEKNNLELVTPEILRLAVEHCYSSCVNVASWCCLLLSNTLIIDYRHCTLL